MRDMQQKRTPNVLFDVNVISIHLKANTQINEVGKKM